MHLVLVLNELLLLSVAVGWLSELVGAIVTHDVAIVLGHDWLLLLGHTATDNSHSLVLRRGLHLLLLLLRLGLFVASTKGERGTTTGRSEYTRG